MSLANTKPFFDNEFEKYLENLKKFNLLDYGQQDEDFDNIYDPDSRVEKYINACLNELPDGFTLSGHQEKSRNSCGKFLGIKSSKSSPRQTAELLFHSCGKLACKICVRKSATTKALKIEQKCRDFIWYLLMNEFKRETLSPSHFIFSPVDGTWDPLGTGPENFYSRIKEFLEKYIIPYLIGGVAFFHHHRFKDNEKLELRNSDHIHVIGFGYMPDYDAFAREHGFIYSNKGTLISLADIFRVARYELTHVVFPQRKLIRRTKRTEFEIDKLNKHNEWQRFLKLPEVKITEFQEKKSIHSIHSYFYFGYMSPYKIRILKEKKVWLPERHKDTKEKMYHIIDGVIIRFVDKNLRWKYFTLQEAQDKALCINVGVQINYYKSRLKWGKLCKQSHLLRWISIKTFRG